jgi:carboxymethylenebutenolidase
LNQVHTLVTDIQRLIRCGLVRASLLSLLLSAVGARATAQDWAKARLENSPRHLEFVTVSHGDREVNCFVAYPEVPDPAHAVVVVHDISGMGDWIRGVADQLAEAGYVAIVPDLLSQMGPASGGTESFDSIDDARRVIPTLPPEQIKADLDAAAAYVRKLPASKGTISVAGFCWGGGQALRYATNNKDLSASFVFYGFESNDPQPIDAAAVARIGGPVYGFYAENDARVNAALPALAKLMADGGRKFDQVTYKGAGHGFMRHGEDPDGTEANKKAREDAWIRWKELLKTL